jgi:outer membrane murein-binding lipoprotein Lpp
MQRIIAVCVTALLLAGCSQNAPLEDLADGKCTGALADVVDKHISGQIDALAEKDWELAHSFASDNFRANASVDDFTFIIGTQYAMLIDNEGYQFNECDVSGSTITQEVSVTSGEQVFSLFYTLTVDGSALGVESAVISKVASQIDV